MVNDGDKSTIKEFKEAVNMSPKELGSWLETDDSKKVGYKETEGSESVGRQSGRQIIDLLKKKQDEYNEGDMKHIRKVIGYIHRHLAQKPEGNVTETNWRYSLMNWGHDPKNKK